jgi:hypothetical protein
MELDTVISSHAPYESSDTVNLIVALLVRFPEISSIGVRPKDRTVKFSYVVGRRLGRVEQRKIGEALVEHIGAFVELGGDGARVAEVSCEADERLTFVHVVRDSLTISKSELELHVSLLAERFGESLVRNAPPSDSSDEEQASCEELAEAAIDVIRDPSRQKSVVGFREEKRVHVYFVKSAKKAKASARS